MTPQGSRTSDGDLLPVQQDRELVGARCPPLVRADTSAMNTSQEARWRSARPAIASPYLNRPTNYHSSVANLADGLHRTPCIRLDGFDLLADVLGGHGGLLDLVGHHGKPLARLTRLGRLARGV
jgi:hypothetical protein